MIRNHFLDHPYAVVAAKALGLEFYSADQIRSVSFFDEVEEGDWFLQYRRPGLSVAGHRYKDEDRNQLPPVIRHFDLDYGDIGFLPQSKRCSTAFRVLHVSELFNVNEHRSFFEAESLYSRPSGWGFKPNPSMGYDTKWYDKKEYAGGSHKRRNFTLKPDGDHYGIIGKFKDGLDNHFSSFGYVVNPAGGNGEFHALFRALQSNEPFRPSVVGAVEKWTEELGIDLGEALE